MSVRRTRRRLRPFDLAARPTFFRITVVDRGRRCRRALHRDVRDAAQARKRRRGAGGDRRSSRPPPGPLDRAIDHLVSKLGIQRLDNIFHHDGSGGGGRGRSSSTSGGGGGGQGQGREVGVQERGYERREWVRVRVRVRGSDGGGGARGRRVQHDCTAAAAAERGRLLGGLDLGSGGRSQGDAVVQLAFLVLPTRGGGGRRRRR